MHVAAGTTVYTIDAVDWLSGVSTATPAMVRSELCSMCGPTDPGAVAVTQFLNIPTVLVRNEPEISMLVGLNYGAWETDKLVWKLFGPFEAGLLARTQEKTLWIEPQWDSNRKSE